ncbi:MAG: SOS response-associated peptidase [Opitutales bacterium]
MCGRYTLVKKPISIGEDFMRKIQSPKSPTGSGIRFEKRYNIAPTQENLVIRKQGDDDQLSTSKMRWGLIPSWSKTGSTQSLLINARSETIADKPSFKAAYKRRRCLVPADGYFEWKRQRKLNQPHYLQLADESVFYMAGIWETWHDEAGNSSDSYAILTTQANALAAKIHDRMPVILLGDQAIEWLEGDSQKFETDRRFEFFASIDSKQMQSRPVNSIVNDNRNDCPECIEPPLIEASTQLDMEF